MEYTPHNLPFTNCLLSIGTWTEAQSHLSGHGFRQFIGDTSWPLLLILALALVLCMLILPLGGLDTCHLIDDLLKYCIIYAPRSLGGAYFRRETTCRGHSVLWPRQTKLVGWTTKPQGGLLVPTSVKERTTIGPHCAFHALHFRDLRPKYTAARGLGFLV